MNRLPLLLPIRSIVFVLVFVIGALAAHKHVDEISNWWSIIAVVVNIMNILLLVYAARRNGKTYWELINYQKGKTRLGQVLLVSLMILTTTGALRKFKKRYISLEVGMKQCCKAKKNAGTRMAAALFRIWLTPQPRYRPFSAPRRRWTPS